MFISASDLDNQRLDPGKIQINEFAVDRTETMEVTAGQGVNV